VKDIIMERLRTERDEEIDRVVRATQSNRQTGSV
jgi:hypothetical protein